MFHALHDQNVNKENRTKFVFSKREEIIGLRAEVTLFLQTYHHCIVFTS
jgi:hypothetical protein